MTKTLKVSIILIHFLLVNLLYYTSYGQTTKATNTDLQVEMCSTKGSLSYLNYGDGTSRFEIPCTMEASFKRGKLRTYIVFEELDKRGKPMNEQNELSISEDGQYLIFGRNKWQIISNKKSDRQIEIIAEKRGKDDGKLAVLRTTLIIKNGNSISWKKDVRYDGTRKFFNRNQYCFSN